jgi:hypothetical protein
MKLKGWSFFLVLAAMGLLSAPAYATITYIDCTTGCANNAGYSGVEAAGSGLTFSASPLTFASGNLVGSVYTDPTTGALFTGTTTGLTVNGTSLEMTSSNSGARIDITLPANTYAVALSISVLGSSANVFADLGVIAGSADVTLTSFPGFYGVVSDTPLTSLIVIKSTNFGGNLQIDDFKLGIQGSGGGGSETPEPSSVLLFGSGLMLLPLLRYRQTKRRSAQLS